MNTKNWADQQEEEEKLKERNVTIEQKDDIKTVTEIITDKNGQKFKVIKKYKVEVRKVPKSVIKRKAWKKFGNAVENKDVDKEHFKLCEDTKMEFINVNTKQPEKKGTDDQPFVLKSSIVRCRICQGAHYTRECDKEMVVDTSGPEHRILIGPPGSTMEGGGPGSSLQSRGAFGADPSKPNAYVPPHERGNISTNPTTSGFSAYEYNQRQRDECTVKVTNLPLICDEKDLGDLFNPVGPLAKTALIKDKSTKVSKGIAYITYKSKSDAARAVKILNHYKYANMILNVEWARGNANQ